MFSNADGIAFLSHRQLAERQTGPNPLAQMRTIIEMDPPEHRDFRKVASGFFTPRSIERLDAMVSEVCAPTRGQTGRRGRVRFRGGDRRASPAAGAGDHPRDRPEDEDLLLRLTQQLLASDDPDLQRKAENRERALAELGADLLKLFNRVLEDRRAHPREDLATIIAHAKMADGSPMPMLETLGYYLIVFTAGHDTTRNAISGGMAAFLDHPEQLARLGAAPELARPAVEEIIRWSSPVNYMKRRLLEDVEMHGVRMREGEDLVMFYASANRDETVFERPFEFDISRHPNRHIGFGSGEHFCLGAHVARLSSRALFRELATRIEWVEPAGEAALTESNLVVGHKALPIRYKLRPAA